MSRDIKLLHPEVQAIIPKFLEECEKRGLKVKTTDTIRTKQEQDDLYAQGRTKPGNIVTWVKYPYSNHNWGMAFDICRNDGKGAYNDSDGWFAKVGKVGKEFGLVWGGDWKGTPDKPHFELTKYGDTNSLAKKYKTPENFKKTWKYEVVEEYMTIKRNYSYHNKTQACNVIEKDGEYFIRARDMATLLNKDITYDSNTKNTTFKDVTNKVKIKVHNKKEVYIDAVNIEGSNYMNCRQISDNLGYNVLYDETNNVIMLTLKDKIANKLKNIFKN